MVVVSLEHGELTALLGQEVPLEELATTIPMIGGELEGIEGSTLRVDIFPNRPDLYSAEGIARALRGALELEVGLPEYSLKVSGVDFLADKSVESVRPFVVGGLVTDLSLTETTLVSLVDLQERLHTTLGRRRRRVAIGLHDFDPVEPPLRYLAVGPKAKRFVPLGGQTEMSLAQILQTHEKGREYAWILEGQKRLPLILDDHEAVLSFPPIINGTVTALTPDTTHLFLDVTGTEFRAVSAALNIMMTALADRGGTLQSVTVIREKEALETPDLTPMTQELSLPRANALLGLEIRPAEAVKSLRRMRLGAKAKGDALTVRIPGYRTEFLHEVDLIEDLAIGYGYDRFEPRLPREMTLGRAVPLNDFTEVVREVCLGHGLQEIRTATFQSSHAPYQTPGPPTVLANPLSTEFDTVRGSLLPSALEILRLNRRRDLPQRFFEVDDVVREGRNQRRLAGVVTHPKAGFTEVKGLVLGLCRDLGVPVDVTEAEDPNFIPGRCATPHHDGDPLGILGEVHPEVIVGYDLQNPVVAFELDVEALWAARRGTT